MKNSTIQQILFPASQAYQQHGLIAGLPIAFIWLSGFLSMTYGLTAMNGLNFGLGFLFFFSAYLLSSVITTSTHTSCSQENENSFMTLKNF